MGDRKTQNRYIPPDFDPKKISRLQKPKNHQKRSALIMLHVRVRWNTCGNYMSEGTKFNCRGEEVTGETYQGLQIDRFYIKCTNCFPEVTIKTDPENSDYTVESGATRLYKRHEEEKKKHEESENALESLQKRSMASKREIELTETLDEMKSMKSRRASVTVNSMLEALSRRKKQEEENVEEELLIKSIKFGKRTRVDEEKHDEEKKKHTKRSCDKSLIRISSVRIISNKTKKIPMGLESLCHNYGTDGDKEL